MSSSDILVSRTLLPPFRATLDTRNPAHRIAELRHATDVAASFTVCLWTANSGQALERAGWKLANVERIEITEAFAAVPLAVLRALGIPEDIVNVDGGAIAHGHPIGATGAVLTTRLLHAMRRDAIRRGVVTLCIGGGQGIALALEVA